MRVYAVYEDDDHGNLKGVFDREGLKSFLKAFKKEKGSWTICYTSEKPEDPKAKRKYWTRFRCYATQLKVVSCPLNKESYGTLIQWQKFKL